MTFNKDQSVLIVGAGVFGLSTALHLLQRGWKNITIIDRSMTLPAQDAASTDINKVVRSCYSDPIYTRLAREAIAAWKDTDEWGDTYRDAGVILRGGKNTYVDLALQNDIDVGANVKALHSSEELRAHIPYSCSLGSLLTSDFEGYITFDGGWANATQGVEITLQKVRQLGARIELGKPVYGLSSDGHGLKLEDGSELRADVIVVASGSWTPSCFLGISGADRVLATGQSVATIQLSENEARSYANVPVIWDCTSGFYIFPPTATNVVKMGFHGAGYTHVQGQAVVSTPHTHVTHPKDGTIPIEALHTLRATLRSIYPELGERPFSGTRMCWYADTPDSDWLIDFHPDHPSVLFATGGSGHAYKFLPILGRLIADRIENKLEPTLAKKFAFDRVFDREDLSRRLQSTKELDISQLCGSADLLPKYL